MAVISDIFNPWKLDLEIKKPGDDVGSHTLSISLPKNSTKLQEREHLLAKYQAAAIRDLDLCLKV